MRCFFVLISAAFLFGCNQNEAVDVDVLIKNEVQKQYDSYIHTRAKRCHDDLMKEVRAHVDSIVVSELTSRDEISMPQRPERPASVEQIVLDDSTRIAPVLDK